MQEKAKMTPGIKLLHQNYKMGFSAGVACERARWKEKQK